MAKEQAREFLINRGIREGDERIHFDAVSQLLSEFADQETQSLRTRIQELQQAAKNFLKTIPNEGNNIYELGFSQALKELREAMKE